MAVPVLVVLITAHEARAGACPPSVALSGEPAVVQAVRDQLDARGIADATPACPFVRARVERRGSVLVVGIEPVDAADANPASNDAANGAATGVAIRPPNHMIEREVTGPATAATVIESWTRRDVAEPLLAVRAVPVEPEATAAAIAAPASPAAQGIQLFAAAETSFASDHTVWQGMQIGACVMLGPICAAARVHGAKVVGQPDRWDGFTRKGAEVYAGIDVPIAVRWTRLTLGFAAGYGTMFTRHHGNNETDEIEHMGVEISGPRAEVHAAWSLPISAHFAIDVAATAALTQATGMETHGPAPDPAVVFPDEPRALFRLAIGVRYGAL